jgi:hypothetical protein
MLQLKSGLQHINNIPNQKNCSHANHQLKAGRGQLTEGNNSRNNLLTSLVNSKSL